MFYNNLIFSLILVIYCYFQNIFILKIIKKNDYFSLSDDNFEKPQAFHLVKTHRSGGLSIYLSLLLVFFYLFISKNIFFFEYISFCTLFFVLGLIDDLKINFRPKFRLLFMILLLLLLVTKNGIYIEKTGLGFLNNLLETDIFSLFFIILCFLFIVNGSNLIDGFNGLLSIHAIVILVVLFFINLINGNMDLAYYLFFIILIILTFLKFNFPEAQMFLGDSGAYLIGTIISISVIKTSLAIESISPIFFCLLLFYLFFEVFFSFFRKILFSKQSPLLPDNSHLHMLFYKFNLKKNKSKIKSNYLTSIYINLIYFVFLIPPIYFMKNGLFCKYYFLFLLISYIYFYKILKSKSNR